MNEFTIKSGLKNGNKTCAPMLQYVKIGGG